MPSEPATKYAEMETIRFTNAAGVRDDGSIYRIYNPNDPQYVGDPSPEIDANWDHILHGTSPVVGRDCAC